MNRNAVLRTFLLIEGVSFVLAATVHFGILVRGWEHRAAGTAESVIGSVLVVALALTLVFAARTRLLALLAQGFALLGTFVGLFTIAIGVGPRTTPDLIYHAAIVLVLGWGLVVAGRASGRSYPRKS